MKGELKMASDLELVLVSRSADLPGGLHVSRSLPQAQRRMVGPFIFVDQMGPAAFLVGREVTVLPHPHIGLSTVTFLFEGQGLHRDSLGSVQPILAGEVNWMTAGGGIVHSERMQSGTSGRMFGIQTWVALPKAQEEAAPSFMHYGLEAVPSAQEGGIVRRVMAGSLWGMRSRVQTSSPLFYGEALLESGAVLQVPPEYDERAVLVVEGSVQLGEVTLHQGEMAVLVRANEVLLCASEPSRLLLLGGEPLDGPRFISWNFVASSKERLKQASEDWRAQRFARVPGETEYIPLPEDGTAPVRSP